MVVCTMQEALSAMYVPTLVWPQSTSNLALRLLLSIPKGPRLYLVFGRVRSQLTATFGQVYGAISWGLWTREPHCTTLTRGPPGAPGGVLAAAESSRRGAGSGGRCPRLVPGEDASGAEPRLPCVPQRGPVGAGI